MNDTLKIVVFVIGALVIIGILWSAVSKNHAKNTDEEGALPSEKREKAKKHSNMEPSIASSEGDISPDLADKMARAAEEAVAASRGEPHQSELNFEPQEEMNWQSVVKESLQTRLKKVEAQEAAPKEKPVKSEAQQEIVVLNLMAPRSTFFFGRDIVQDLERFGLTYGRLGIYHYVNALGNTEFSVALAVEPGFFDLDNIDNVTTPGLVFFMNLHANAEPKQAFKRMLSTVHEVASHLGGDILDQHRQRLTQASVTEYLARIKGFDNYRKAMNG